VKDFLNANVRTRYIVPTPLEFSSSDSLIPYVWPVRRFTWAYISRPVSFRPSACPTTNLPYYGLSALLPVARGEADVSALRLVGFRYDVRYVNGVCHPFFRRIGRWTTSVAAERVGGAHWRSNSIASVGKYFRSRLVSFSPVCRPFSRSRSALPPLYHRYAPPLSPALMCRQTVAGRVNY
jgi:hypothetical protein